MVTQLKVNKYLKQKFENQKNLKTNISNALLTPMKESCLKIYPVWVNTLPLWLPVWHPVKQNKPLVPRASRNMSDSSLWVGSKIETDRSLSRTESRRLTRWSSRVDEIIEKLEDNQSRVQRRTTIIRRPSTDPSLKEIWFLRNKTDILHKSNFVRIAMIFAIRIVPKY